MTFVTRDTSLSFSWCVHRSLLQVTAGRVKKHMLTSRKLVLIPFRGHSESRPPMILVQHILEDARKRLSVLSREAMIAKAAEILANPDTPLVVVCDSEGIAVGVVSSSDIVKVLARAAADAHNMNMGAIMTSPVLSCRVDQPLQQVWDAMNARSLRSVPIFDDSGRPQGVVHARDLARALLDEVDEEEISLRDYVLGIGYQ